MALCTWAQRVTGGDLVQRVLPDGCADIIVDARGHAVVVGPARQVTTPLIESGTLLRGLRLRSEAVTAVLGVPASDLVDATVALDLVVSPPRARAAVDALAAEDWSGVPWWTRVEIDARVRAACEALRLPGRSVDDVAGRVGLSGRQLRRLVVDATGIPPKTLQRVGRLQRFVALSDGSPPPWPLARLAATAGYADQAHLSREVRELAGTTAMALLRERYAADNPP